MAEISKIIAGDITYHLRDRNYCTCSTGAGTKAKTASLEGFVLTTGSVVNVRFDNSNTASDPTLNINDTGAYAIKRYGTTAASTAVASSWQAGSVVTLIFDGTYWMIGHGYDANTTYSAMSASEATTGTSTTGRLIGAKVLHDKINSLVPDPMTAEEATAGTSMTARTISAKILQDKIEEMKQTNAEMGQGYGISGNSIVTGSNELPYPFAETTKTVNGITFTDNGNGSITIDGTATDDTRFKFCENLTLIAGRDYIASFSDSSYDSLADLYDYNNSTTYYYLEKAESQLEIDISGSFYFEPNSPSGTIDELGIRIGVGDTFDNFVVYPKISSDDSTYWEPYTQSLTVTFPSYELVEGGIVAVKMNIDVPAGGGMNINNTGVLPIKYKGSAITSNIISSGDTVTFVYSNGNYHLISIDSGGSNTYTLPTASASTLGGVKVGNNLSINDGVLSATNTTYENKAAVSGGVDVSLVTTGQKYTWDTKMNNYGTCSTAANTAAKTVSLSGFVLTTGATIHVYFNNSNTASNPTLNVNDTGAYVIMRYGSTSSGITAASSWNAGSVITLVYDGTYWVMADFNSTGMYIASYGSSTYAEVLEAYQDNKIIYCRASSNTNPATGNQLRMAFLAYVSNQTTPTTFEFQYYRSVRNHSGTQQGDQVYVYQLNQSSGWSVTVRQSYTKIAGGTGLNESYSNGVLTLNHSNSVTAQTTQAIYPIKIDAQGHINSYGSAVTPLTADSTLDATKLSGAVPRASLPSNYGTCSTAANVAAKTVNLSGFVLTTGSVVNVRFDNSNTASDPTLNINDTGAYAIKRYGTTAASTAVASSWQAGSVVTLIFDGTYWMIGHGYDDNTTYSVMPASEATTGTSTSARTISAKVLHDKIDSMLPGSMTAEEATAGTSTTARTISAKILQDKIQDEIEEMKQTNASLGQGYGEVDSITRTGKNMLPYPYEDTTKTINGITFTDNGDGTITANGTVDSGYNAVFTLADSPLDVINPLEENVILSGCPEGGSSSTYCVYCQTQSVISRDYGSGVNLGYQINYAAIIIYSDTTVSNLTFSPMIRLSTESSDWEAYNGPEVSVTLPSYELSEGGIVAIKTDDEITRGSLLNINNTGAKQIFNQVRPLKDNEICSGDTATFIYSNNIYYLLSVDRWQNLATPSSPGLMSASDKDKLNTVARNANNYYLPTASANVLGGVKVGTNLSISSGVLSATDTTYENKAAVNGGTDLSLVTTGEKFKWNMDDYCTCSTGASTADKTASLDGFVLNTGASVKVKFTNTNTAANPTLNINSTGAKPIMLYGTTPAGNRENNSWSAGSTVEFIYDGTNWVIQGGNVTNNAIFKKPVYIDAENGTDSAVGTSTLWVGNGVAEGTAGNSKGQVVIYGNGANYVNIQATNATANRTVELPNENGTLMTNQGGTFSGDVNIVKPNSGTGAAISKLTLGNNIAYGTVGNTYGALEIYSGQTQKTTIYAGNPTADRELTCPDASGTIALDTAASQSAAGLMSAADKTKLDGIAAGANAYTLPVASSSAYGGIKVGNNLSITDGVLNYTLPMASASTLGGVKVGTNLSINASTGVLSATDTTYSAATQSAAGLMSAADKKKLDGVATGANAYSLPTASASALGGIKVGTNLSISNGVLSATNTTYSAATQSAAGLMSAADKKKLDGVATGANAYSLPTASASTLGGIKVGTNLSISNGVLSATDTTYSAATQSAAGLMSTADKKKLDAITPYPTAYSTSGNWKRLTFSNKIQILWCTQTINGVNVTTSWGSSYYARIGYWVFPWAFNAVPTVVASLQGASGGDVSLLFDGSCSATATQTYYAIRPASGSNINITVGIIAFGTYS